MGVRGKGDFQKILDSETLHMTSEGLVVILQTIEPKKNCWGTKLPSQACAYKESEDPHQHEQKFTLIKTVVIHGAHLRYI